MFKEQYRKDNDRLHAPSELLERIKAETARDAQRDKRTGRRGDRTRYGTWARYAAVAATAVLVFGGALGLIRGMRDGRANETAVLAAPAAAAAPMEAAELPLAADAAMPEEAAPTAAAPAMLTAALAVTAPVTPANYDELFTLLDTIGGFTNRTMRAGGAMEINAGDGVAFEEADKAAEMPVPMVKPEAAAEPEAPAAAEPGAPAADTDGAAYSDTNVQVAGVDEADIVKTDGKYLYYLANGELYIAEAKGRETKLLSRTAYADPSGASYWGEPREMFLSGDTVVLFLSATNLTWRASDGDHNATFAVFYDVSDRSAPKEVERLGQSGVYVSSRRIDDTIYLVTTQYLFGTVLRDTPSTFVPRLYDGAEEAIVPVGDIRVRPDSDEPVYTVISAMDIGARRTRTATKAVLGGTGTVYMNAEHLLIAASESRYDQSEIHRGADGRNVRITRGGADTRLMLFGIGRDSIDDLAIATVPGYLLNQFSIDEYNGVFRIVTTVNEWEERVCTDGIDTYEWEEKNCNALYTLDSKLAVLGKLEDIAENEFVESVRFDGDIGYFVTFRQVDPLFSVDLRDPKHPKILGALKIPGFSEYLHPYGEDRLLGIGYDADEYTGRRLGVKLSMFDTSDKADVRECAVHKVDADWMAVGENHRAMLVNVGRNIIAFPTGEGYRVYAYTDADGFTEKASVTFENAYGAFTRGVFIGDWLYVLSETGITALSLDTWRVGKVIRF